MTRSPSDESSAHGGGVIPSMRSETYETFVVRLLVRNDGDILRGHVTHVSSGQQLHFTEPERVPDLIRRQLATANAARRMPRTHEY